jgi:hypothetical protein
MPTWVRQRTIQEELRLICDRIRTWPDTDIWPPAGRGVYVVSEDTWPGGDEPPETARVRYVGKGDGKQGDQLRKRVGDLVIDLCGYWNETTGHHTLPHNLHMKSPTTNPMNLYLSWSAEYQCPSCAEQALYVKFKPSGLLLNIKVPSRCKVHS